MKINFDNFRSTTESRPSASTQSPIKISIESPVYNSVVRQVSPNNYQSEINSINSLINLPVQVSRFLQKQIEKQMIAVQRQQKGKRYAEVPQGMSINFLQRTSSEIIQKQKGKAFEPKIQQKIPQKAKKQPKVQPQINSTMRSTKNKTHIKKQSTQILPTQARHTLNQISQLTCRPLLYPSKITDKISQSRKQISFGSKQYSVYDNLYNEANDRKLKSCLNEVKQKNKLNDRKPKINSNYYAKSKFSYTSIYCRLDEILEKREAKRQSKLGIDQTTGREMFKPDTSFSKDSYRIFFNSLSKQKLVTKRIQTQQPTHPNLTQPFSLHPTNPNTIDIKTIEHFTKMLYPDPNPQISHIPQQNPLRKQQFMILHPFLHEIEELQSRKYEMETTTSSVKTSTVGEKDKNKNKIRNILSREEFQIKLRKFYKGLSLHDRQVLRKQAVNRRRNYMESHVIKQDDKVFKPIINVRSASLDNLAKGHTKNIYYI